MKKTLVIDESIRESVHQTFKRESALQYSYKVLIDIAEQCRQAAWNEMYERHPVLKGTHAVVNFNTWACTYEPEEYPHAAPMPGNRVEGGRTGDD